MRPHGSTLTAPPSPRPSRRRTSASGSSRPSVRPQRKGPCGNLGYKKATARADVPPWRTAGRTCRTRAVAVTPHCQVSHSDRRAPLGAPGHPCIHSVGAPYKNLGYKKATARADVPPWTTAGRTFCTRAAAVTPHCRVSHSTFALWTEGTTQLNSLCHHYACASPQMMRMTPDRSVTWPLAESPPENSPT